MKKRIIVTTRIAAFLFCFVLFFAFVRPTTGVGLEIEFLDVRLPMYYVPAVGVDSKGRIFFDDKWNDYLQVYSKTGDFLYGIASPGSFEWIIDEEDCIQLYAYSRTRQDRHIVIKEKTVVLDEFMDDDIFRAKVDEIYDTDRTFYRDEEGYQYKVEGRKVEILDPAGNPAGVVKASVWPFWPPAPLIYWFLMIPCLLYVMGIWDHLFNKGRHNAILGYRLGQKASIEITFGRKKPL